MAASAPMIRSSRGVPIPPLLARVSDASSKLASLTSERPEVVVAAAFVGGLVIATILKRLAR